MSKIIEIDGELVRTIERTVVKEVALADMLDKLERKVPVTIPVLPQNNVVSINFDPSKPPAQLLTIAVAIPPRIRLLPINEDYRLADLEPEVALPWTILVYQIRTTAATTRNQDWGFTSTKAYFSRTRPVGQGRDTLIAAKLPNISGGGEVCWGTTGVDVMGTLADRVDELTNGFYESQFTHGNADQPWPNGRPDYRQWVQQTERHGRTAYRRWRDWTNARTRKWTLEEVMALEGDRNQPIVLADGIPELRFTPTFGYIDETWLPQLNGTQLVRLEASLANLRTEHPERFQALATPPVEAEDEDDQDVPDNDDDNDDEDDD